MFCCDLIEKGGRLLAVTGGEDDKAYLWDPASGEVNLFKMYWNFDGSCKFDNKYWVLSLFNLIFYGRSFIKNKVYLLRSVFAMRSNLFCIRNSTSSSNMNRLNCALDSLFTLCLHLNWVLNFNKRLRQNSTLSFFDPRYRSKCDLETNTLHFWKFFCYFTF